LPAGGNRPGHRLAERGLRRCVDHLRDARADGPVWSMAQGAHLAGAVSLLPARHVQAPEILPEIGAVEMSAPLLSVRDLSVRYGGVLAVNKVSFDVHAGEVFTLIGPNGAGKTTVFNLISRIYTPTSGTLSFDGRRL